MPGPALADLPAPVARVLEEVLAAAREASGDDLHDRVGLRMAAASFASKRAGAESARGRRRWWRWRSR